ncbi:MAG: hypothetical protein ACJAUO_001379 [Sediminicola sp.]|jgi:hypothetical protein
METPVKIHDFTNTPFPERIPLFENDPSMKIMKATENSAIHGKSYYWVSLTAALKGKHIGA